MVSRRTIFSTLVVGGLLGCASERPPIAAEAPARAAPRPAPSVVDSAPSATASVTSSAPKKWIPPDCGPGISHYMVSCDPAKEPSCGPEKMKPVLCPK